MSEDAGPGRDDGLARLLWGWSSPPARGPRPSLDLHRIAAETMTVADTDGLAAVSMQRVADRLGVTKMALYRYVASKDELLAVTIEAAVGEPPDLPTDSGDWRSRTRQWAEALRTVWTKHPWLPAATLGDRLLGPREIGWSESAARALEGSGLDGAELRAAITLLFAHARASLALDVTGTQYWNLACDLGQEIRQQIDARAEDFPLISTALPAGSTVDFDAWAFGLDVLLDGIASRNQ